MADFGGGRFNKRHVVVVAVVVVVVLVVLVVVVVVVVFTLSHRYKAVRGHRTGSNSP